MCLQLWTYDGKILYHGFLGSFADERLCTWPFGHHVSCTVGKNSTVVTPFQLNGVLDGLHKDGCHVIATWSLEGSLRRGSCPCLGLDVGLHMAPSVQSIQNTQFQLKWGAHTGCSINWQGWQWCPIGYVQELSSLNEIRIHEKTPVHHMTSIRMEAHPKNSHTI